MTLHMDKSAIIKKAQKYTAQGDIDKAIAEWQKLSLSGKDSGIYNLIGDLYLKKRDKENAIEAFKEAADFFRKDGFSLKAIAIYKKILNIDPSDTLSLIALGELNAEKGLIGNANEYFLAAVEIFTREGSTEKVLDIYKRMLSLSPSDIPLKIKVAELYNRMGMIEGAIKEYIEIADLYSGSGKYDKSKEFYQRITLDNLQNVSADTLFNYSRLAIKLGYTDDAKQILIRLTNAYSSNKEYKKLLGRIYLKEGVKDKAWKWLSAFIEELILLKKWDDALELLGNFSDFNPIEVKRHIISIYNGKGDKDSAIKEMLDLAGLCEGNNLLREALQLYEELLELSPSLESAREKIRELRKTLREEIIHPKVEESITPPLTPETLKEGLEEAEFYIQQGLKDEAIKLYERLLSAFPDNKEIAERLWLLKYSEGKKPVKTKKDRVSYI